MALMKAKEEISDVKRDMRRKVKELRDQMATMERNHETQLMVPCGSKIEYQISS